MPPKFANHKPREIIRALQKGGFYVHEQTGSHVHLKHRSKPGRITVPNHERFDVPNTSSKPHPAGRLTNQEFFDLLDQ